MRFTQPVAQLKNKQSCIRYPERQSARWRKRERESVVHLSQKSALSIQRDDVSNSFQFPKSWPFLRFARPFHSSFKSVGGRDCADISPPVRPEFYSTFERGEGVRGRERAHGEREGYLLDIPIFFRF